jgi:uncharacterized membrane protein
MLRLTCLLFVALLLAAHDLRAAQPSFTPLPDLPGGLVRTFVRALSANGEVAVGASHGDTLPLIPDTFNTLAYRWTRDGGMVAMGTFPGSANDVSADGKVIVGTYAPKPGPSGAAFRWTADSGFASLEHIVSPGKSRADSVSPDGRFIGGLSGSATEIDSNPVRWTADGKVMDLGTGFHTLLPVYISSDGSVVAGTGVDGSVFDAFRWTAAEGVMSLQIDSSVRDMTPDGRLIIGGNFRWTAETGMTPLPFTPNAVSDDGLSMIGFIPNYTPVFWTAGAGVVELQPFLTGLGLDLTGWRLTEVTAISGDGTTIAGHGIPPDPSMSGAWIATIPEPPSWALAVAALTLCFVAFRVSF